MKAERQLEEVQHDGDGLDTPKLQDDQVLENSVDAQVVFESKSTMDDLLELGGKMRGAYEHFKRHLESANKARQGLQYI